MIHLKNTGCVVRLTFGHMWPEGMPPFLWTCVEQKNSSDFYDGLASWSQEDAAAPPIALHSVGEAYPTAVSKARCGCTAVVGGPMWDLGEPAGLASVPRQATALGSSPFGRVWKSTAPLRTSFIEASRGSSNMKIVKDSKDKQKDTEMLRLKSACAAQSGWAFGQATFPLDGHQIYI